MTDQRPPPDFILSPEKPHAGYEFESGMFSRFRSWVDVAPWIRLARVLRLLASPSYVGLVLVAVAATSLFFATVSPGNAPGQMARANHRVAMETLRVPDVWLAKPMYFFTRLSFRPLGIIVLLVMLGVWIPVIQMTARVGAALTAGQTLPPIGETFRIVRSRWWKSYLLALIPVASLLSFMIAIFLLRIPSMLIGQPILSVPTGWILGVMSLAMGVLGFGALFAIPLGMAAMVSEPDPDPIDSLSRGYEYLVRRPLSLVWYALVSAGILYVISFGLRGVAEVAKIAIWMVGTVVSRDASFVQAGQDAITVSLVAWNLTLAFALLGGVYLMLRRDAGGQEVEDLWSPPRTEVEPLAKLPKEAFES